MKKTLRVGLARVCITPEKLTWLHGYAGKPRSRPIEGKLNDLYAKTMALEDARGTPRRALPIEKSEGPVCGASVPERE